MLFRSVSQSRYRAENVANQERDGAKTEEINQDSPSPQYEGTVTYTQFGEPQEGTLYYEDGVAKIKDKAGKVYNANSPLVTLANLGNAFCNFFTNASNACFVIGVNL